MKRASLLVVAAVLTAGAAHADRVVLVGGTVLDGEVERKGGKVIVQGEAGTVAVPADSVVRIEKAESAMSRFEARYAALRPGDVGARLALADYCRANDLKASERRMLLEVIAVDADNAAARARLGYVKTGAGWVTEADAMRARGLVQHEGQWMSEATVRELERMRTEVAEAARQREDTELATKRARLAAEQAAFDAERERSRSLDWGRSSVYTTYLPAYRSGYGAYGYGARINVGGVSGCYGTGCGSRPAPIHQAKDPYSPTEMSVVKVPYRRP